MEKLSLGPFDLVRPIGKGSVGVVWEAIHRGQSLPVAVKILTAVGEQDESFRRGFVNEVRAVARLHHPSIIRVLDYGVTDSALFEGSEGQIACGSQFYAMELATGGTLPKPKAPLPWLQMRFLLLELLDALAHAHARDVIHRDIKPGNILLMRNDAQSRVMLNDFGIAKAFGTKESADGTVAGTPRYMAPEQILNQIRDQGPWTDLYSLGCLAYLFATGRRIFSKAFGTEILRCHLHEAPEPVTGRHLPEGFQGWLSKMLAKNVSDRFEYAAEAAWELVCLPDPVEAEPENLDHQSGTQNIPDSCEYNVVEFNGSSSIFNTLYQPEQVALTAAQSFAHVGDNDSIADDLLADMGETMRMDSADIAQVISAQSLVSEVREGHDKRDLSTLAEVYRQRMGAPQLIYNNKAIVPAPDSWRHEAGENRFDQILGAGLGLWGLRSIPMVGRDAERDIIYAQLLQTRMDRTVRCVILDGPRGCGKSRLVEWMSQRAHELSIAHTLKAYHYEDHLNAPGIARAMMYYLSCQNLTRNRALERIRWFLGEHRLDVEYDDALPMLQMMQLQDDPDHPVPGIRFADAEEQFAVLCRFFRRVSHDRAVVLWLDDVHNSLYSLEFVEFVLNSEMAREIPLLILATARGEDIEQSSSRDEAYKRLESIDRVTKLDIAPLPEDAHLELVHQLLGLDDELCSKIASRTNGMPLFAIQLVGDWVERGLLVPGSAGFVIKDGASIEVPDSLHELWLSRLRVIFRDLRQQSNAMEQLEIAACLGVQFDADEWRIACEMAELGSNAAVLESLLAHRLFVIQYPTVRFAYDLLRESLIRNAKENGRLKRLHHNCADMLEAYFSEVVTFYHERRAEHLYAAEAFEACIEPLLQAAVIRRQCGEYAIAHALFKKRESCLDACNADKSSPIRALGWLAEAETWLEETHFDKTEELIECSLDLGLRTHSPLIQALAYKVKGNLLHLRNNITESIDALMASLAFFNQVSERRRAAYLNDRAETLWLIGRICDARHELDLARIYFQQAVDIQTQTKDTCGLAKSYKSLGNTYQHGGLYQDAKQNLEFALNLFQQIGFRIYIAHCLNDIGEIHRLGYFQLDTAEAFYRNSMDMYREINIIEVTPVINLALLLLSKQRYSEAKTLVLSQIEIVEKAGQSFDLNWLYAELLPCCAATFDWPTFDDVVLRLGKSLEDSMVVDADILYCTELACGLCERYATREKSRYCREIAMQQAVKLNDQAALKRLRQE